MAQNASQNLAVPRVQRAAPRVVREKKRLYTIASETIQPLIRIAHEIATPINIAERIIFDHELVLILGGTGRLVFRDRSIDFSANHLLFIPPFVPHAFVAVDRDSSRHVAVHFDFARGVPKAQAMVSRRAPYAVRLTGDVGIPSHTILPAGHRIEQQLRELLRYRASNELWSTLAQQHALTAVLLDLLREGSRTRSQSQFLNTQRIAKCAAYIREHLTEPINASDLARVADLSPSRLRELFVQHTGFSPLDFVRRQRIEEARKLLADPSLSVKQVARLTGFDDVFHFSRVFRKVDGLAPTHFREALLASIRRDG